MTDANDVMSNYERHRKVTAKANALNKRAIFDALVAAGIVSVTVTFNGEGDSGQIEDVTAEGQSPDVPDTSILFHSASWGSVEIETSQIPLIRAVTDLCYDYLSEEYDGWENNDGAFGEFIFDVAKREVSMDFNARFSDFTNFRHTF